ncbi:MULTISPECIES: hypothetical protein [Streptomyces]|nr:hypothetical protein [Streptomyces sp. JHD 1]MCX2969417.1 hypothetical protein [Streptomyces sp. JHD 1]
MTIIIHSARLVNLSNQADFLSTSAPIGLLKSNFQQEKITEARSEHPC